MKTHQKLLLVVTSLFLFTYCGNSQSASTVATTPTKSTPPAMAENISPAKSTAKEQKKSPPNLPDFTATCTEQEEKNPGSEDPIIIKTCTYGNYKTVSTGSPDYKGRYSYENSLYRLNIGEYQEIENAALFNQKQGELLKQINEKIKADYLKFSNEPETQECFTNAEPIRDFSLDELRIGFDADQLVFHAEFGLPSACLSVNGTAVSFKLQEVAPYLNK